MVFIDRIFVTNFKTETYSILYLSAHSQFSLCSAMYFSLRENMMCGVRAAWLVGHSNSNKGEQVFVKGKLDM